MHRDRLGSSTVGDPSAASAASAFHSARHAGRGDTLPLVGGGLHDAGDPAQRVDLPAEVSMIAGSSVSGTMYPPLASVSDIAGLRADTRSTAW